MLDPAALEAEKLMFQVGERVHSVRRNKGLTRQALSERSGVSPRYLAQLEGGSGNISLTVLARVAFALDLSVQSLVANDRERGSRPIALVGLRGAGKTTLGAMAAERIGVPFVELNQEIATLAGTPVTEVMALYGPEGYRDLEAQALQHVIGRGSNLILAVAGGIVSAPETYEMLLGHFRTIWLKATPEDHMARVRAQGDTRPMKGNPEAMAQLKRILNVREPLYARAARCLDTSSQDLATSADLLESMIRSGSTKR